MPKSSVMLELPSILFQGAFALTLAAAGLVFAVANKVVRVTW